MQPVFDRPSKRRWRAGLGLFGVGLVAGLATGSVVAKVDPVCDQRLPAYDTGWLRPGALERLALDHPGGGSLLYLAAQHTNDPWHPDLARFERELKAFRPTLVLYEGGLTKVGETHAESVRRYGEAGFLRFVAREAGVPARSFDPDARTQIRFLSARFDPEQVKVYFVLREVWLLRERRGLSEPEIRELAVGIIEGRLLPELPAVLRTEGEFAGAFARRWKPPHRWLAPPAHWFDPYAGSARSGGLFTNDLERATVAFRDRAMYRVAAAAVLAGERVFAVAGSGHLPVQAPALRCALDR